MSDMHIDSELRRRVRQLQIHTRRLLSGMRVGDTRSAMHGSGFDFDQIREYQPGDDVRFIDWKASARSNQLLVKEYTEERSKTILLCVDMSRSTDYGSGVATKYQMIQDVAGVVAMAAGQGQDYVGLLLFSDSVQSFVPPRRGKAHVNTVVDKIFTHEPQGNGSALGGALKRIAQLRRRDAVLFVISDFMDDHFLTDLKLVSRMCDTVALRCLDICERQFPDVGLLTTNDAETGMVAPLHAHGSQLHAINRFLKGRIEEQDSEFRKAGVDLIDITPGLPFIDDLIRFFCRRMQY